MMSVNNNSTKLMGIKEYEYIPDIIDHPKIKSSNLIREIFKYISDFFGEKIGKQILFSKVTPKKMHEKTELIDVGRADEIFIHEKATKVDLNALVIYPSEPSKRWILVFNGMGDQYTNHTGALKKLADDSQANILTFDYRSVGKSTGKATSMEDLIHDGEMALNFLIKGQQINPKNILFYGHSMGGGVAAKLHQKVNHPGPFLSESSFSTFAAAISLKRGRLMGFLVKLFNWDLDATKLFKSDQLRGKGFIVNRRDPIVKYEISLYKHLKKNLPQGTSITRIKIGTKYAKESMEPTIEKINKIMKIVSRKRSKAKKSEQVASDYQNAMAELKKKKLLHHIQHPHERILDRTYSYNTSPQLPPKPEDLTSSLFKKFRAEDEVAYKKIISLIGPEGALWNEV